MRYRADIDGLRAIAVLPVVFFHAGIAGFTGGFVGVDVFFVISGYLITGIIQDELNQGRFSLGGFYERRFRRIIPALGFVMLLTTIAAWLLFLPAFLEDYGKSLVAVGTFTSNIYFWKYSGYFESSALLRPLLHTWSLAVEEQFYIVMPLAMLLLTWLHRKWRLALFIATALISLGLSIYATSVAPTANFFLLPTRSWELLIGSILAIAKCEARVRPFGNSVIGIGGILLIAAPVYFYSETTSFPGLTALAPCLGAALVIYSGGARGSVAARLLSVRALVFIGRISYSLYLIHWPVTVFARYLTLREPGFMDAIAIVTVSGALAIFSWHFVEGPFRSDIFRGYRYVTILGSLSAMAAFACIGYNIVANLGFPDRFPDFRNGVQARSEGSSPLVLPNGSVIESTQSWRNGTCFFEDDRSFETWRPERCLLTADGGEKTLLWGDSFAAHYAPGIIANASSIEETIYQYTQAGCPPVFLYYSYARPGCHDFNKNVLEIIRQLRVTQVVLSGRWIDLELRGLGLLQDTIDRLNAENVRVIVIGQSPMFVTNVDVIAYQKTTSSAVSAGWNTVILPSFNERLRKVVNGAAFIDPIAVDCSNEICNYLDEGRILYFDSGHLSNFGSSRLVKKILPLLAGAHSM